MKRNLPDRLLASIILISCLYPAASEGRGAARSNLLVEYYVKNADTLYGLASAHLLHRSDWEKIRQLNRVQNPRRMRVGQRLLIPKRLLRHESIEGRVRNFKGAVTVVRAGKRLEATLGMALLESDILITAPYASVSFGLPDGTVVTLPSQTQIRVEKLRRQSLTGRIDREFRVIDGELRGAIAPIKSPSDSFRFITPNTVAAVRGTELRIYHSAETKKSSVELLEGKLEIYDLAGDAVRQLAAGYGAVSYAGILGGTKRLLPAPTLSRPDTVQENQLLEFQIDSRSHVAEFKIEISNNAGFLTIENEKRGSSPIIFPSVADGVWFVRISAIDADGMQGLPRVYSFRRRALSLNPTFAKEQKGEHEHYLFRFSPIGAGQLLYRFQLFRELETRPIIDEASISEPAFALTDLPPGEYRWRVGVTQSINGEIHQKWTADQQLTAVPKPKP